MEYGKPTLDMGIELLDAEVLYKERSSGETLHICYSNGKYSLQSRIFNYDVDWDYHFPLTLQQAREIVAAGYATWWLTVDDSVK